MTTDVAMPTLEGRMDDLALRVSLQGQRVERVLTQLTDRFAANGQAIAKAVNAISEMQADIARLQIGAGMGVVDSASAEKPWLDAVNTWCDRQTARTQTIEDDHGGRLNRIASLVLELQSLTLETANRWGEDLAQRLLGLGNEQGNVGNAMAQRMLDLQNAQGNIGNAMANSLLELQNRQVSILNSLASLQNGQGDVANALAEDRLRIEKYGSESFNLVTHTHTSIQSHLNEVHADIRDATHAHEIIAQQLTLRRLIAGETPRRRRRTERYRPAERRSLKQDLAKAEIDFPRVFPAWKQRLDTMSEAFRTTKVGNAANALDVHSRAFRQFVGLFARGRILDIGSGVFGRAFYLHGYPATLISEIEPLPLIEASDAEHVQGIGEYLPWPDRSFSTIISGTSLDHSLSLEKSLSEIRRVLAPEGRFLLWIGSNPGAPAYRPDFDDFEPADQFHLFHFDVAWFEPMLEKTFDVVERVEMKMPSFSHVFYCLQAHPAANG